MLGPVYPGGGVTRALSIAFLYVNKISHRVFELHCGSKYTMGIVLMRWRRREEDCKLPTDSLLGIRHAP